MRMLVSKHQIHSQKTHLILTQCFSIGSNSASDTHSNLVSRSRLDTLLKSYVDTRVSNICKSFYLNVKKHTGLQITTSIPRFKLIIHHVYCIEDAKQKELDPVSFVPSSKMRLYHCKDLITSAIIDMKPKQNV